MFKGYLGTLTITCHNLYFLGELYSQQELKKKEDFVLGKFGDIFSELNLLTQIWARFKGTWVP